MWPRAIRTSIDGKITLSFVCDPKNPEYGKVEALFFDDHVNQLEMTEWDFGAPGRVVTPEKRINRDRTRCESCHGANSFKLNGETKVSMKHIWPEYHTWADCNPNRGISAYGSMDDDMNPNDFRPREATSTDKIPKGCNDAKDKAAHKIEVENFKLFKEKQKNDPCFGTLPWAKSSPTSDFGRDKFVTYPYAPKSPRNAEEDGKLDYRVRPNLRLNDVYSHLNAKRIATILRQADPKTYDLMKYYIAMEGASCLEGDSFSLLLKDPAAVDKVSELLGVNLREEFSRVPKSTSSDELIQLHEPFLYFFAKKQGVTDEDWNLEFKSKNHNEYNAGMAGGDLGDLRISQVVEGEVLKSISEENDAVRKVSKGKITRGVTQQFRDNFSCIDDLGGAINPNGGAISPEETVKELNSEKFKPFVDDGSVDKAEFCRILREENNKNLARLLGKGSTDSNKCKASFSPVIADIDTTKANIFRIFNRLDEDSVAHGKELANSNGAGKCVTCHGGSSKSSLPPDLKFFPDGPSSAGALKLLRMRVQAGFLKTVRKRLIEMKTMPPGSHVHLSDEDREDIAQYLQSLAEPKQN